MVLLGTVIIMLGIFTYLGLFVAVDVIEKERKDKVAWKHYWKSTTLSKEEGSWEAERKVGSLLSSSYTTGSIITHKKHLSLGCRNKTNNKQQRRRQGATEGEKPC